MRSFSQLPQQSVEPVGTVWEQSCVHVCNVWMCAMCASEGWMEGSKPSSRGVMGGTGEGFAAQTARQCLPTCRAVTGVLEPVIYAAYWLAPTLALVYKPQY